LSFNALVLAGSRGGPDPVADYAGVAHKALIVLQGQSLLARVVGALKAAGGERIGVCASDPAVRAAATHLGAEVIDPAAGPSQSVRRGAEAMGTPLLVTTADHALLRPEWVSRFLADIPPGADLCALVAGRPEVSAAAPTTQRTYLKFADGDWSGCNLFYLANPRSLGAVDLWRRVEADRKRPWRIAAMLGPGVLLRYAAGRLTLDQATARLGQLAGVTAAAVRTPYGLAAVDVDKPADLDLVREITGK
jgi:GTP:adenosylcobinamide-phosphate guanylyltransferase